jgi:hypothetical protein
VELIHDTWFELDRVRFEEAARRLVIPFEREMYEEARLVRRFGPLKRIEIPIELLLLSIHHVLSHTIEDSEGVGRYDLNSIAYDESSRIVRVVTGIPLGIRAEVTRFELSVERTGERTGVRRVTTLRGPLGKPT